MGLRQNTFHIQIILQQNYNECCMCFSFSHKAKCFAGALMELWLLICHPHQRKNNPLKGCFPLAEWVGFEPTGDCSHDGFRVHAVMTTSVPLRILYLDDSSECIYISFFINGISLMINIIRPPIQHTAPTQSILAGNGPI